MANFVLVAGHWLGGWAWEDVTPRLRAAGHDVHPVTLTGLGNRSHLAGRWVDLNTHTTDIVRIIEYAELQDVILVGHSGGGMPVSVAADRIPHRIGKVVYIEAGPLAEGQSQADTVGPAERARRLALWKESPEAGLPLPTWEELGGPEGEFTTGLGEAERTKFLGRAVAQPLLPTTDRVHYTGSAALSRIPHVLVTCIFPVAQVQEMMAENHPFFAGFAGKQWDFAELPTGHWPMFSEPAKLASTLGSLETPS